MSWNFLNWIVIFIYFLIIIKVGIYFSKKNSSTKDYFNGGKNIPAWVTACSIYATALSSLSFMAIPASIFKNGWIMGMAPFGIMIMVLWAAHTFVPFFRQLNINTAYEYLENRFNQKFRIIGSITFIIFHIIRVAVVLYLPVLAISEALPNINTSLIVGFLALLCVSYTSVGGIKAVVWSDAIQTIVLLIGAFIVIISGIISVPSHVNIISILNDNEFIINKHMFSINFQDKTLIGIIIGGFLNSIYAYVGSQDIVQRYNTTKTTKEAQKSLYMNIPLLFTSVIIFVGMGTGLFLFFNFSKVLPKNISGNSILPYYIIHYLPKGISGLVIAGIFAASQSTISSSLNSITTCITKDFVGVYWRINDKKELKIAKYISWIVGITSSILALRFLKVGQGDIFLYFQGITGLLGSPIAGVFLIGIFIKKATSKEACIGFIISIIVALYIGNPMDILNLIPIYKKPKIFEFLISFIVIFSCVFPAYLFSLFKNRKKIKF